MTDAHYHHVYLSPHLDDAVLCCGGLIHRQVAAGTRPLVITLFAGPPRRDGGLSDFARQLHESWGLPGQTVAARWAEDRAAMSELGADYLRLNYPDCIYRGRERAGEWYYPSREALFGPVHPAERGLPAELAASLVEFIPPGEDVTLYAPLTVGNHVDHQLTFAAAQLLKRRGWPVQFYEDFPYAEWEGALADALASRAVQAWQPHVISLDEDNVAAKIRAIACYGSQLEVLFKSEAAMPQRVREYTRQVGGERFWNSDKR
jgi:LmbE family N-acetylglucosaminyl deacetylase